ncbi:MAG: hypothetical protein ABWY20_08340 [Mycobacterium sp.]
MGDFDNLAAEMTRRERNMRTVRGRGVSEAAEKAWAEIEWAPFADDEKNAFVTGFDLARDTTPINYARIAVLQTERETIRRQMERDGTPKNSAAPSAERYWAIDKEIREALT